MLKVTFGYIIKQIYIIKKIFRIWIIYINNSMKNEYLFFVLVIFFKCTVVPWDTIFLTHGYFEILHGIKNK